MRMGFSPVLRALAVLCLAGSSTVGATSFTVNSTADRVDALPGDGVCSAVGINKCTLRAAIQEANAVSSDDVITLPAGHYTLTRTGPGEDAAATGDLDILDDVDILGAGADQTIVDAAGLDRVFHVMNVSAILELQELTVTGGVTLDDSTPTAGHGGGIFVENDAGLYLQYVRVSDNIALNGGGIGSEGARFVSVVASEVTANEIRLEPPLASVGGGILLTSGGTSQVAIFESTISDNRCQTQTGANCFAGVSVVICGNPPGPPQGFGLYDSTISGNRGIGLYLGTCAGSLEYATIYGNTGYGIDTLFPGSVSAVNSIFANNTVADCDLPAGAWTSTEGNISSDGSCDLIGAGDQVNTDPELYPLGYFSPPPPRIARSHHPRWDSPAIDQGKLLPGGSDQDGYPRGGDGDADFVPGYDIGSIEVLDCVTQVDLIFMNQTLTTGTQAACNTLTADPNVIINGTVEFAARDSVRLGNGFEVTAGSDFTVSIRRDAGAP